MVRPMLMRQAFTLKAGEPLLAPGQTVLTGSVPALKASASKVLQCKSLSWLLCLVLTGCAPGPGARTPNTFPLQPFVAQPGYGQSPTAPAPARDSHEFPQVVLVYDHSEPDGRYVVEAKGRAIMLLTPIEDRQAPLEPGTLMVCRPYNDSTIYPSDLHFIGFRCGMDKFVMTGLEIRP